MNPTMLCYFNLTVNIFSEPPSMPLNLSETFVDQSSVLLSWLPPRYLGGRNDTFYRVSCDTCSSSVAYVPSQQGFTDTKVTVTGLSPVTTYTFKVYAENGVSSFTTSKFAEITITTDASGIISKIKLFYFSYYPRLLSRNLFANKSE